MPGFLDNLSKKIFGGEGKQTFERTIFDNPELDVEAERINDLQAAIDGIIDQHFPQMFTTNVAVGEKEKKCVEVKYASPHARNQKDAFIAMIKDRTTSGKEHIEDKGGSNTIGSVAFKVYLEIWK
jgi:hypothetical protein